MRGKSYVLGKHWKHPNHVDMDRHWAWKGGVRHKKGDYIRKKSPGHRRAIEGYVFEHILVYEEFYKCCVLENGVIHHKNRIKTDNRIENLEGMTRSKHTRLHMIGKPSHRKYHGDIVSESSPVRTTCLLLESAAPGNDL